MPDEPHDLRSTELASDRLSVLVVIDVQTKLLPLIAGGESLAANVARLAQGARRLGVPILVSEQYPERLGPTIDSLKGELPPAVPKREFSAADSAEFRQRLAALERSQVIVAGLETHVCVLQTVLDLLAQGYQVQVVADAVGCRGTLDGQVALARMQAVGATVTTTEAVLFEWCRTSQHPEFKAISNLVRQGTSGAK